MDRLALFPQTVGVAVKTDDERLTIAGCDLDELAERYGTPLYLYDQATLESAATEYQEALAEYYPGETAVTYAGKAFLCLAMAQWVKQKGLWLDCTGVGEMGMAAAARLPRERTVVHGVNKSADDLAAAVAQAGTIVVDNLWELNRLASIAAETEWPTPELWLRFRPGLTVDSHAYTQTGHGGSKFGLDAAGIVEAARLCRENRLPLTGLHFHLGSSLRDLEPVKGALEGTLDLAVKIGVPAGWTLSPGGGLGVAYHEDELPQPSIKEYVRFVAGHLLAGCRRRNVPLPRLQLEPGRSLVARAGVALYRVGAVKLTDGRRWLLLDGGMADNSRPALYGARYSALPVREPGRVSVGEAWLAGPYCESGDILIAGLPMAGVEPGELIAVPVSGAYQLALASNYNGALRPAVLLLASGKAHLIHARETVADLIGRDHSLPAIID